MHLIVPKIKCISKYPGSHSVTAWKVPGSPVTSLKDRAVEDGWIHSKVDYVVVLPVGPETNKSTYLLFSVSPSEAKSGF